MRLLFLLLIAGCAAAPGPDLDARIAEKQRSLEACTKAEALARARLERAQAELALLAARIESLALAASLAPPEPGPAPRVREVVRAGGRGGQRSEAERRPPSSFDPDRET